ncbi:Hypothetical predicted protein [Olea europaea subsp. europaea]|uniref:Uncharacterized protein n=1 Tax=Olea europaea subsp. europaea TaxID=158383 RepID=A0A8S0RD51_OLEEU|nr:Hypothetical predicted protein [Olea europaea subsp. europaea]
MQLIKKIIQTELNQRYENVNVKLEIVPIKIFNKLTEHMELVGDHEKCVLMNNQVLDKHQICNGHWITVFMQNELGTEFKRTLQVLGVPTIEAAIISDLNMFNIIRTDPVPCTEEVTFRLCYNSALAKCSPGKQKNEGSISS